MNYIKRVKAVDLHACGEPGRVIVEGVPDVPGTSMFEKMRYMEAHLDDVRKRMLREPRGYPASNCNVILPPTRSEADAGFVIMEQVEYPPMSGTNTICVVTALIETRMVQVEEPVTRLSLEAPGGMIAVEAEVSEGKVEKVTFENVPCFAVYLDEEIRVPEIGTLRVDVAYGGMFYVIADASDVGLELTAEHGGDIARVGEMIKIAANEQLPVSHPENPDIDGITISQLSGFSKDAEGRVKNAVVVSTGLFDWKKPSTWTGALDRSPCGTGTCAKMAVMHAKGNLALGEEFPHEGPLGTVFTGRLLRETKVGEYRAVVPSLSGTAWITGFAEYVLDEQDPFPEGFTLGDIWG